jgi:ketosteroid isomerase-like protein
MLKKLTENYIAAFSSKNLNAISEMLTEHFVLEDPVVKKIEGKSAALECMSKMFEATKELNFRSKNIFQDGNSTIIEFILELDGVRLEGVDTIEWNGNLMSELRAYLDIPKV